MANNKYKVATNLLVSDLIASGSTNSNFYQGFPAYRTTNLAFEKHLTEINYKVSGTDLINSVVAFYRDYQGGGNTNTGSSQADNQANNATYKAYEAYGNTITASDTVPNWCSKIRVIVIGAGGGGGGGGANTNNLRAGAGGGGGGGGLAAGEINVTGGSTYNITLGGCGTGGYYEPDSGDSGYSAKNPVSIATSFYIGQSVIQANCGSAGDGGRGVSSNTNISATSAGGTGSVNTSNVLLYYTKTGNTSIAGNNNNPGEGGTLVSDALLPTLNTNEDQTSNTGQIAQDNDLPGYGQGGVGGLNSSTGNGNGYGGQCGGRSLVRVYFIR
ncbi:MAG: hypothetical protein ACOVRN_15825 [Flavobacterium sp.]